MYNFPRLLLAPLIVITSSCSRPNPTPDQTATGSILGAAISSGAGAVVGHQVGATGPGALVGAGFGLISGGLTGLGLDRNEKTEAEMKAKLEGMQVESSQTRAHLREFQQRIDFGKMRSVPAASYQVFFEENQTNLRAGAVSELEALADAILRNDSINKIVVVGHSDDTGNPDYNSKLSQARADSVAAYLKGRGISSGMLVVSSKGSAEPIASNDSIEGRSRNRRVNVSFN